MSLTFLQFANEFELQVQYVLRLPITIANSIRIHTVYLVPRSLRMCFIGNDLIRKHNLQIHGRYQIAYFKRAGIRKSNRPHKEHRNLNESKYILTVDERIRIPLRHVFNTHVRPNKQFHILNEDNW